MSSTNESKKRKRVSDESEQIRKEIKQGNIRNVLTEESGKEKKEKVRLDTKTNNNYVVNANKAICMKMIKSETEIYSSKSVFHPEYTYQLFGEDEEIIGYKNLKIELYYSAGSLATYLAVTYDEKLNPNCDPFYILTQKVHEWEFSSCIPIQYPVYRSVAEFKKFVNEDFTPPATQIDGYTVGDSTFEIYRGNLKDPALRDYAVKLQTFALFFIDGATYIDEKDERWSVFMLFERYKTDTCESRLSLVGFATVYPFFAYPDRTRLRVSQFFIIPTYWRQGHGSKLLNAVYSYAKQTNCVEVAAEDPSNQFLSMRDRVDFHNYRELSKASIPVDFTKQYCAQMQKEMMTTKDQVRRCWEIARYEQLKFGKPTEDDVKRYRLQVKRRLFGLYDIEKSIIDAEERKEKLAELYSELEPEYLEIITTSIRA